MSKVIALEAVYLTDLDSTCSSTGDLTIPTANCTQLNRFTIPMLLRQDSSDDTTMHAALAQNLPLAVGGDGIIGRRMSVSSMDSPSSYIAEGIVGFNSCAFWPKSANI